MANTQTPLYAAFQRAYEVDPTEARYNALREIVTGRAVVVAADDLITGRTDFERVADVMQAAGAILGAAYRVCPPLRDRIWRTSQLADSLLFLCAEASHMSRVSASAEDAICQIVYAAADVIQYMLDELNVPDGA